MEGGESNAGQKEESQEEKSRQEENHQEESCQEEKEKIILRVWIKKRADVNYISSFLLTTQTTFFDYQ